MAPTKSKQADRRAAKKAAEEPVDEGSAVAGTFGAAMDTAKGLVMESCIWTVGNEVKPMVMDLLQKTGGAQKTAAPAENAEGETKEGEANGSAVPREPEVIFESLKERLVFFNCLGLGQPATGEEAKDQWLSFKGLEFDGGPRKARKGNPGVDRVLANFVGQMPQYLHLLMALMLLRSFLFISWFALLPWMLIFQNASLLVPLELVPQCPTKFRVLGALALHGLVLLFFLREFLWRVYFFERVLYLILLAAHAYVVRPMKA